MRKFLTIALLGVGLCGCGMDSNEQVEAIQKCKQYNLWPDVQKNETGAVVRVVCLPEKPVHRTEESLKACQAIKGVPIFSAWDGRVIDCKK